MDPDESPIVKKTSPMRELQRDRPSRKSRERVCIDPYRTYCTHCRYHGSSATTRREKASTHKSPVYSCLVTGAVYYRGYYCSLSNARRIFARTSLVVTESTRACRAPLYAPSYICPIMRNKPAYYCISCDSCPSLTVSAR